MNVLMYFYVSSSIFVAVIHDRAQYALSTRTLKIKINKKVLLRERKRHTRAACVANARYAALSPDG